jgi:hypothetical protein
VVGSALGFDWPRKLLLEVNNRAVAIDYVIRESAQVGGNDKSLVIHYEPRGCKGYNPKVGSPTFYVGKGSNIRICSCAFEREQFKDCKARRTETYNVNVRAALGALPPKPCAMPTLHPRHPRMFR